MLNVDAKWRNTSCIVAVLSKSDQIKLSVVYYDYTHFHCLTMFNVGLRV